MVQWWTGYIRYFVSDHLLTKVYHGLVLVLGKILHLNHTDQMWGVSSVASSNYPGGRSAKLAYNIHKENGAQAANIY